MTAGENGKRRFRNDDCKLPVHVFCGSGVRSTGALAKALGAASPRLSLGRRHTRFNLFGRTLCVVAIGGLPWVLGSVCRADKNQETQQPSVVTGDRIEGYASAARMVTSVESAESPRPETLAKSGEAAFPVVRVGVTSSAEFHGRVGKVMLRSVDIGSTVTAAVSWRQGYSPSDARTGRPRDARDDADYSYDYTGEYAGHYPEDYRTYPIANRLYPYDNHNWDYYYLNQPPVFRQFDRPLGFYSLVDPVKGEGIQERDSSLSIGGRIGLLTRDFDPEQAMLKLGPVYFDLLWVGAGGLWTDYSGSAPYVRNLPPGGWAAYIEAAFRVAARLGDNLYLSASATIIYLPLVDRWAFGPADGAGAAFALLYVTKLREWNFTAYERFDGWATPYLFYKSGIDEVGRYYFGVRETRPIGFSNGNAAYWANRVGASASHPVFDGNWLMTLSLEHLDFWQTFDFVGHEARDQAEIRLSYGGSVIPFSPYAFYRAIEPDGIGRGSELLWNQFGMGAKGHISQNVTWEGEAGLLFYSGSDNRRSGPDAYGDMGFRHVVNSSFSHWLRFGEGFVSNDMFSKYLLARYVAYGIDYQLNSRTSWKTFVQYADRERNLLDGTDTNRLEVGSTLSFRLTDSTQLAGTLFYDQIGNPGRDGLDYRWIYRADLTQQIGRSMSGTLFYRYEDGSGVSGGFREHVAGVSLRYFF